MISRMKKQEEIKLSKYLSLILRHQPELAQVQPDASGWVAIDELLRGLNHDGRRLTREDLDYIVENSDKQRFAISDDGKMIRANQGHTYEVDLGLEPEEPPALLYHGTAKRFLPSIFQNGVHRGSRHHVHLSTREETAVSVGKRHGNPIVLIVDSGRMYNEGYQFFRSANGIWLTEHVPAKFVRLP